MWNFASTCLAGNVGVKNDSLKASEAASECSDDDVSSVVSREESLECPICWESFNMVENVPYVLWCGHTLCKNCILGLQWAVVKFPTLPVQLPLFISCPWCNLLSFRVVYKGNLKFPRKNYFLLWMVESMNGDRVKSHSGFCEDPQPASSSSSSSTFGNQLNRGNHRRGQHHHHYHHHPEPAGSNRDHLHATNYLTVERIHSSLRKSLIFFVHLTAKFPLVVIFLLIVVYAIPASAAILALYILVTILFALPSFLILYFAYPSLDWLVREIVTWAAIGFLLVNTVNRSLHLQDGMPYYNCHQLYNLSTSLVLHPKSLMSWTSNASRMWLIWWCLWCPEPLELWEPRVEIV